MQRAYFPPEDRATSVKDALIRSCAPYPSDKVTSLAARHSNADITGSFKFPIQNDDVRLLDGKKYIVLWVSPKSSAADVRFYPEDA